MATDAAFLLHKCFFIRVPLLAMSDEALYEWDT
jgi:hypothetical protein